MDYKWIQAFLIVQLVKNPPAMQETPVQFLGWEALQQAWRAGKGKGYPLQYSSLEDTMVYIVRGVAKSQTRLNDFHFNKGIVRTIIHWKIR